jgi:hypothetical protein
LTREIRALRYRMQSFRRIWSRVRHPRLQFTITTYEDARIDLNPPTDPAIIACLSTPTLHRLVAGTTLPRAQIAINAELAVRSAWRGPARWALLISSIALVMSIISISQKL